MRHFSKLSAFFLVFFVIFAGFEARANTRTFPAGSYIIPMDSVNQPEADGGIFEAYGLVFDLLENGATVYWIIDENKTSVSAPDITISNTMTTPVVSGFGTTSVVWPGAGTDTINYSGAPFVIVPGEGLDQASTEAILGHADWSAVNKHVSNVPFTANVSRELTGIPPKIALLNNQEDVTSGSGNAQILESYLMVAGICNTTYDIITPNMTRDGILQGTPVTFGGTTYQNDYTILWAPHWTGYSSYNADNNGDGQPDVENIIANIRTFLEAGNAFFAECASIEVVEHSQNGHFLTSNGINHDGGTMDPARIIYNDTTSPFPQVGDFSYVPEGGHLHNWRPWNASNSSSNMEAYPFTPVPTVASQYNATVSRFTHDDWDTNLATTTDQWDYYIGGRIDGNESMGYVVYLGGHKYINTSGCAGGSGGGGGGGGGNCTSVTREWEFEFKKDISNESFTVEIKFTPSGGAQETLTLSNISASNHAVSGGSKLFVDFTNMVVDKKKLKKVSVENKDSVPITINSIKTTWTGGNSSQKTKKLKDKTVGDDLYSSEKSQPHTYNIDYCDVPSAAPAPPPPAPGGGTIGGCVDNSGCSWKNVAGVRYVLNTLFNLQYAVISVTYNRSSPIVMDNVLYQGTFDYPSYRGHMNAYNVLNTGAGAIRDLSADVPAAASRNLYTTVDGQTLIPFTKAELATNVAFQNALNLGVAYAGNEATYDALIDRVRGVGQSNLLGAVEHSAPAIVKPYGRSNSNRPVMAYFGTLDGILEAFNVDSLHGGTGTVTEVFGFIPYGQLASLQNDRGQPNSVQPYPGVDASPTVSELLLDHDNDPTTDKVWRTVLTNLVGKYGAWSSAFALDITDPENPDLVGLPLLFGEVVGVDGTGNPVMGAGYRTSVGTVRDSSGAERNFIFAATNKQRDLLANPPDMGGIQVFAFDMADGSQVWRFSVDYVGTQNELPGAITLVDKTFDSYVDTVVVGDMDGRLWELNAADGSNVNGTGIPLFNGGAGATVTNAGVNYPISASPTIVVNEDGHFVVVFGTGGADWAPADATHIHSIIAIDMTEKQPSPTVLNGAGVLLWQQNLDVGEKAWSSPTVANNVVYVSTAFGTMESANPGDDLASTTQQGKIRSMDLQTGALGINIDAGNQRGSVYIKNGHAYGSTLDGNVVQVGDEDFSSGTTIDVKTRSWKQE